MISWQPQENQNLIQEDHKTRKGGNKNKKRVSDLLDLAKYRYISEVVSDHELDFISVMETRKQDMSNKNLSCFCSGAD